MATTGAAGDLVTTKFGGDINHRTISHFAFGRITIHIGGFQKINQSIHVFENVTPLKPLHPSQGLWMEIPGLRAFSASLAGRAPGLLLRLTRPFSRSLQGRR
ncbi:MAG TPA: hypothetical protein VE954_38575, partial [Oligoflexus sp.]|nr:hypothetical protein [Oligoflexus sp.]